MARPANQTSGAGNTNRPRKPSKPKPSQLDRVLKWDPSHLAAVLQAGGISPEAFKGQGRYQQGQTFRQAYDAYRNQNNPAYFAQPQTLAQANLAADAATRLRYGGVEASLNQQIKQTPQWYQNYKDSLAAARQAAQTYQQGLVDQSTQTAQQIGQAVLQGDSPAAQADRQAAQSRQALASLGTDLIRAGGAANDAYFGARPGIADASQIAAMTKLFAQQQQLAGEKADFRTSTLNDLRQNAANNYLAQQTLGANVANQQADNAQAAANAAQTAADRKAARVVSRKNTRDRVAASENRQAAADQKAAEKAAAKEAADAAKHKAAIGTAVGRVKNRLTDITGYRQGDVGKLTLDKSKPKDEKTGQYPTRKVTQADIDAQKIKKFGFLARIAIALRDGRKLDQAAVDYLHQLDPDFRVPRSWLPSKPDISRGTGNPASSQGTGLG